jgi:hypothetical protein
MEGTMTTHQATRYKDLLSRPALPVRPWLAVTFALSLLLMLAA